MAPYDDDSDYEDDFTNAHLGLADGALEGDDEANPLVSRIGGRPAWLPLAPENVPPASEVQCMHCGEPMELLVQIFAPLEDSAYDRNLFVWGCSRAKCQRQGPGWYVVKCRGSRRCVRMLKHNPRWAAKLAKQEDRRRAREEREAAQRASDAAAEEERKRTERTVNPFSMSGNAGSSLFGESLFDAPPVAPAPAEAAPPAPQDDSDDMSDYDEEERLAEELAIKASLDEQRAKLADDWARTAPYYAPAQYLNTIPEPQPDESESAPAPAPAVQIDGAIGAECEQYEKMVIEGMDNVFEHFMRRLGSEARQVVRYEFGGVPIPFSGAGSLYRMLWPQGAGSPMDATAVPPCDKCGAPRVFELQLMPNLANLLRIEQAIAPGKDAGLDDEKQRRSAVEALLNRHQDVSDIRTGIAWSTAMVFVCSKDCCDGAEGWANEWIGLQYETDL